MTEPKPTITPSAAYVNVMRVHHNRREFFFDFAQAGMEQGVANLIHRMVTTPGHAKAMHSGGDSMRNERVSARRMCTIRPISNPRCGPWLGSGAGTAPFRR